MAEFKNGSFLIEALILILAHSVDMLVIKSFKSGCKRVVISSRNRLKFTAFNSYRDTVAVYSVTIAPILLREEFTLIVIEGNPAFKRSFGGNLTVGYGCFHGRLRMFLNLFIAVPPRLGCINLMDIYMTVGAGRLHCKSPVMFIHLIFPGHADSERIRAPWRDHYNCRAVFYKQ